MAGEQADSLPPELREWVDERANEWGLERREILARALTAYRHLAEGGDDIAAAAPGESGASPTDVADRLDDVDDRLARLGSRVDDAEDDFDAKIRDVRERVVQVKREADAKAPADHDHPTLRERIEAAERDADDAAERAAAVDAKLDDGFDNFEEVLSYLTDTADDLDGKVDTLAAAVVDLRQRALELESEASARRALDELRSEANRTGTRSAACEDCGSSVDVALLDEPRCPECRATFERLEPSRGFFGSATLHVGERPALMGDAEDAVDDPNALFDDGTVAEADGGPESGDE
jgi:predicted Zn-ribbon and HTH transcriptional regulator